MQWFIGVTLMIGLLVVQDGYIGTTSARIIRFEDFEDPEGPWRRQPIVIDESGGYRNILIALHDEISESRELIAKIKDSFTRASFILSAATEGRVYFRDISILLPSHWYANDTYDPPRPNETYHTARVIIRDDWGDATPPSAPFVRQPGGCGKEGEYMYLTRSSLSTTGANSTYGDSAKIIVKLWGHLRWGLFDEFPSSPDDPLFYSTSEGEKYSTGCPSQRKNVSPQTGQSPLECTADRPCQLFPILCGDTASGHGSLMGCHLLNSVTQFCHSDRIGDVTSRHNHEANTMQNRLCLRRSSWDIMHESEDFQHGTNYINDITPKFRLIRHTDLLSVVVLDVRKNMEENSKLARTLLAFQHYVYDLFPPYSQVGVVAVNSSVSILKPCLKMWELSGFRYQLLRDLPPRPTGSSSLGAAVPEAIKLMKDIRDDINGSVIYIMSDGTDVIEPTMDDVRGLAEEAGVRIVSLPFSTNTAENIALNETIPAEYIPKSLTSGGDGRYQTANVNDPKRYIRVAKFEALLDTNASVNRIVFIDEAFDDQSDQILVFRIYWENSIPDVYVVDDGDGILVYPDEFYDYSSQKLTEAVNHLSGITIPAQLYIHMNGSATESNKITCEVYIGAYVTPDEELVGSGPIRASALLHSPYVNVTEDKMIPLYGTVTQDERPVIAADATAVITSPDGGKNVIRLLDDGQGLDNQRRDGTYSSYFSNFTRDGIYSFELFARVDRPGKWKRSDEHYSSSVLSRNLTYPIVYDYDVLLVFQRAPRLIEFSATDVPEDFQYADYLPPSTITDFRLTYVAAKEGAIGFTWTAPGDDFITGQADGYDLRYGFSKSSLLTNIGMAERVTAGMITGGSLDEAKMFNETESIEVVSDTFPGGVYLYFAIRAFDDGRNYGEISNILEADFRERETVTSTDSKNLTLSVDKEQTGKAGDTPIPIIGLMLGIGVLGCIGAGTLGAWYAVKKHKIRRVDNSHEDDTAMKPYIAPPLTVVEL